jgi:hypothetical protein
MTIQLVLVGVLRIFVKQSFLSDGLNLPCVRNIPLHFTPYFVDTISSEYCLICSLARIALDVVVLCMGKVC